MKENILNIGETINILRTNHKEGNEANNFYEGEVKVEVSYNLMNQIKRYLCLASVRDMQDLRPKEDRIERT